MQTLKLLTLDNFGPISLLGWLNAESPVPRIC
jgi:hypothetical protein